MRHPHHRVGHHPAQCGVITWITRRLQLSPEAGRVTVTPSGDGGTRIGAPNVCSRPPLRSPATCRPPPIPTSPLTPPSVSPMPGPTARRYSLGPRVPRPPDWGDDAASMLSLNLPGFCRDNFTGAVQVRSPGLLVSRPSYGLKLSSEH